MKDIKGFEGLYAVTEDGKVWSYPGKHGRKGKFLKPWLIGHGYETVMLYGGAKKGSQFLIHRLVALTYIPNPEELREVNHKNAQRIDNRVENLEWVSSKGNKQHARKNGLYNKLTHLTEKDVREIRKRYIQGAIKQSELASIYNTTQSNISWIIRGRGWFHVID